MQAKEIISSFRSAQRLEGIGISEIQQITAKATRMIAEGRHVIVLGAGEPDFDTPDNVKEAAQRAIWRGDTKYTRLDGTAALKEAIVRKFQRDNGLTYRVSEVTVGAGAKQVIHNALMATLDPGDEVILAYPYWASYSDMVRIAGGKPVEVACHEQNGFRLQAEDLERAITPRTRWLLLNSPSNPTGSVYAASHLRPILDVLIRHPHVWLISDEIYEHLVYDRRPLSSPAEIEPRLIARTLTVNGVSKAYAMTGWRIGFGGGPSALIAAIAAVQSQSTTNPCSISQAAAIEALDGPQDILEERRDIFRRRRDILVAAINAIDGLSCIRPEGAFYAFVNCSGLLGRRDPDGTPINSDSMFCEYLLDKHGVAVVPGTCFGLSPYFRISYAASDADLSEACQRIGAACERLR